MLATEFTPLSSLLGGAIIGVSAVGLYLFDGRMAGITGILRRAMRPSATSRPLPALAFLIGLTAAPVLWQFATGTTIVQTMSGNLPLLGIAGLLVGFGATIGNGCTSGHGICGLSRFSPRSLAATLTFMATAIATVYVSRHVIGV
jgi:uncharacterized membrane protein YedE/YeeE